MRISRKYNFIYFSRPKTASTSIRDLLDTFCDVRIVTYPELNAKNRFYSHMRPVEARATFSELGWDFDASYRFITVRNPWARLVSLYRMMEGLKHHGAKLDFSSWIKSIDPDRPPVPASPGKWYDHGMLSFDAFVSDEAGTVLVKDAFRIEDQLPDLLEKLYEIGVPVPQRKSVPSVNVAPKVDYRAFYSDADVALVAHLYQPEISQFGYKF